MIVTANVAASALACLLAAAARAKGSKVLESVHDWAAFAMVVFTYKQVHFMVGPIHQGKDYDYLLAAIDRALFRTNPTQWLAGFSNPILTEVLQVAYSLFYVFFIAVGLDCI